MKLRLQTILILMEIIFGPKVNMNQVNTKKPCFRCLLRFVTSALNVRPRHMYINVFLAYFDFCSF